MRGGMDSCTFCRIIAGKLPAEMLVEDSTSVAFLDKFPLTRGQVVIASRRHIDYLFDLPDDDYTHLFWVAKRVAKALDRALGAKRTWLLVQGLEVPHNHIKLLPIYEGKFLNLNEGTGTMASDAELREVADRVRKTL